MSQSFSGTDSTTRSLHSPFTRTLDLYPAQIRYFDPSTPFFQFNERRIIGQVIDLATSTLLPRIFTVHFPCYMARNRNASRDQNHLFLQLGFPLFTPNHRKLFPQGMIYPPGGRPESQSLGVLTIHIRTENLARIYWIQYRRINIIYLISSEVMGLGRSNCRS